MKIYTIVGALFETMRELLINTRLVYAIALLALAVPTICADEEATTLLKKVEMAMSSLKTLAADVSVTVSDSRPNRNAQVVISGKVRLMKPNFVRVEYEEATRAKENAAPDRRTMVIVSDGKAQWSLDQNKNE